MINKDVVTRDSVRDISEFTMTLLDITTKNNQNQLYPEVCAKESMNIHTTGEIKTLNTLIAGQILPFIYFRLSQVLPPNELRKKMLAFKLWILEFQIRDWGTR